MKSKITGIFTIIAVIAILGICIFGYQIVTQKRKEAQKQKEGVRDTAVSVQTSRVTRSRIDNILTFNGDIQAIQSVDVQPKISGRLLTLAVDGKQRVEEGTFVKAGQLIATIDDRELSAQLANAEAKLAAEKAALAAAQADVGSGEAGILNAKATLEQRKASLASSAAAMDSAQATFTDKEREKARQKGLLEKEATTQQNYDKAATEYDQAVAALNQAKAAQLAEEAQVRSAEAAIQQAEATLTRSKASVQQAQAAVMQAEASLQQTQVNLAETKLYSPMDGVVSSKYMDPGSMVSPTTPVVTIMDMAEVKVIISVPVNQLPLIIPGKTKANLRTVSLPGENIPCTVAKIYPAIETVTRTAQVELRIPNTKDDFGGYRLKHGMYATVEILIESRPDVLAVDISLPIRNLKKQIVFVCEGDKVRAADVKLGVRFGDKVEVLDGLSEGEEIVVVGQHRLTDGSVIKRIEGNRLDIPIVEQPF